MDTKSYSLRVDSRSNAVIAVPHGTPQGDEVTLVTFTMTSAHPVSSRDIIALEEALLDALAKTQPAASSVRDEATVKLWATLDKTIDEFEFSILAHNACQIMGIQYIGNLVQKSQAKMLLRPSGCTQRTLKEIREILATTGLSFGMTPAQLQGWVRPDQRRK